MLWGDSLSTICWSMGGTCLLIQYCRRLAALPLLVGVSVDIGEREVVNLHKGDFFFFFFKHKSAKGKKNIQKQS